MYAKFLLCVVGLSLGMLTDVSAQVFGNVAAEEKADETMQLAKPISLLAETENSAAEDNAAEAVGIETVDPDISYYVQNLNLSEQQLEEIKKISQNSMEEQTKIMQDIAALRRRSRSLEINTLMAFEAVLDDTQKAAFQELRAGYEGTQKKEEASADDGDGENFTENNSNAAE